MPTKKRTHKAIGLTEDLRIQFDELLRTDRLRGRLALRDALAWRPDPTPLDTQMPAVNVGTPFKFDPLETERRYGDGHYEDRKQWLHAILDVLPIRVDLSELLKVLGAAKGQAVCLQKKEIDSAYVEVLEKRRRRILTELTKWTREAWWCCTEMGWEEGVGTPMVDHIWGLISILDGLTPAPNPLSGPAKIISHDFDMHENIPGRELKESSPRRQGRPWPFTQIIKETKKELSRIGVPQTKHAELLAAIGLLPYSNKTRSSEK